VSTYDPTELIAICEAVLQDGELSGREVYRLSQWLNENREACQNWPGNLLVKSLQSAWADGKVSAAELHEIGRVLLHIHDEWLEKHADDDSGEAPVLTPDFLAKLDLTRPRLPLLDWTTNVGTGTGRCEVDLRSPTCTCADWQANRRAIPVGHLSRCCRHVLHAYGRIEPDNGWPGWLAAFLGYRWTPHPRKNWLVLEVPVTNSLVLASTAPIDWADVFALDDGEYERFGYNIVEDRWAYESKPADSDFIRRRIILATRVSTIEPGAVTRVRIRLPH
jgi:hypothetical protein